MIGDEVSHHHNVAGAKGLGDALVLGREDSPVLGRFHNGVDVVYLVGLGAGEVDENGFLIVKGV